MATFSKRPNSDHLLGLLIVLLTGTLLNGCTDTSTGHHQIKSPKQEPAPDIAPPAKALQGLRGGGDERRIKHVEAIVLSMTPEERADPSVLNGSRRLRIAKGSGRPVQEVNRLLQQFQQMRKLLKRN